MDIPLKIEPLKNENIVLRTTNLTKGLHLVKDGKPLKRKRIFTYEYKDSSGNPMIIKLKSNFVDPIPKIIVNDKKYKIAPDLKWYEYAWIGLPVVLILQGGAIGGIIGGSFVCINGHIFRKKIKPLSKYALTGFLTILAAAFYLGLATAVLAALEIDNNTSTRDLLQEAVTEINKSTPQTLDEMTVIENASVEGEKTLVYNYKISAAKNDMDFNEMSKFVYSKNYKHWCKSSDTEIFRKLQVLVVYRYSDNTGQLIGDVAIDTAKCKPTL